MRRSVALLASVTLIFAVTLAPTGGDNVVEFSQLGDIVSALDRSDKRFLLDVLVKCAANIMLFLPFGASLGLFGFSIGKAAMSGFVLSSAVEGAQLMFVAGRTTSVDDVMLNSLGALLGLAFYSRLLSARARADMSQGGVDAL